MSAGPPTRHGRRFRAVIIHQAVWLYLSFPLSLWDVEELLAERGIEVSYESVRRRVATRRLRIAAGLRRREADPGRVWYFDEIAVTILQDRFATWREVPTFATA